MRFLWVCGLLAACAHQEPLRPQLASAPAVVRQIDLGIANAFVVMGARPIVVDTGSAGSIVLLEGGDALVGDMLAGGVLFSHSPKRHYFHDDCAAAEAHIAPLVAGGVKRMYLGHAGPVSAGDAAETLRGEGCP